MPARAHTPHGSPMPVMIPSDGINLHGDLQIPDVPVGLVIFVHGSGSSRFSPRNRKVATDLNKKHLATLLLDLLTDEEQRIDAETMELRFDIPLLASRCTQVVRWARKQPELKVLPIGLFGASTGAAAALITAAELDRDVAALVSRGGRTDLAEDALEKVKAPALFIVGGEDTQVLELNRDSLRRMHGPNQLHIVPGATHLFEERGALEEVSRVAATWFVEQLSRAGEPGLKAAS
ncbi:MAG TPA: dienelactone hydrolase family protein [Candidatus Limnocylindrales bacterium]|nr:dienelactone hydrolase family protein [Candidatus Limnocylindrales bacterium]